MVDIALAPYDSIESCLSRQDVPTSSSISYNGQTTEILRIFRGLCCGVDGVVGLLRVNIDDKAVWFSFFARR